ncbi:hypothetical protein RR48_00821 [Papilio machaon]|uniref:Uncharacterized protein n=1 Tax=Papilio machaon TaxID=76193 RepID=A0A0N1PHK8_PAPMA|nr:hypothetical protein RR48_00821 [Papilio machaon]
MEDVLKEPIQLSKGINLKELFTSETEFHIDTDFKKKRPDSLLNMNNDLILDTDEDDSDAEDILKNIESSTEQMMLSSPEYHSFKDLAAKMIDCVPTGDVKMLIIEEDQIIDIESHCKALFYYGRAYEMLGKREEALKYYNKALKLEPKNKEIGKALVDFERYVQESSKKEKEMWQNAFKATPQKKTDVYDVDEDFQNGVREMCQNLVENEGCAQFELPTGLTRNELDFLKALVTEFDGLVVDEEGEGKRKKVTVVKL